MRRPLLVAACCALLLGAFAGLASAGEGALALSLQLAQPATPTQVVEIDLKPDSDVNPINLKSHGVVPVVVFSTDTFDATTIDPSTVLLAGAPVAFRGHHYLAQAEDVNADGLLDLLLHLETELLDPAQLAGGVAILTGYTGDGTYVEGQDLITLVPRDVPDGFWAAEEIALCLYAGVVAGYPDGTYRPADPVNRDQMAVFVARVRAGGDANLPPGPSPPTFPDIPSNYWAFRAVEYAAAEGLVQGFPEGDFRPALPVDRGQMAVFLARTIATPADGPDLAYYQPPITPAFSDVPGDYWAYRYIAYLAEHALTTGYEDGTYRPLVICTRDQMAVYLARALPLVSTD